MGGRAPIAGPKETGAAPASCAGDAPLPSPKDAVEWSGDRSGDASLCLKDPEDDDGSDFTVFEDVVAGGATKVPAAGAAPPLARVAAPAVDGAEDSSEEEEASEPAASRLALSAITISYSSGVTHAQAHVLVAQGHGPGHLWPQSHQ